MKAVITNTGSQTTILLPEYKLCRNNCFLIAYNPILILSTLFSVAAHQIKGTVITQRNIIPFHSSLNFHHIPCFISTVEPRNNKPWLSKVLVITNNFFFIPVIVKYKCIWRKKTRYNETLLQRTNFASPFALHFIKVLQYCVVMIANQS